MAANPLVERPRAGIVRITVNLSERRNPLSSTIFRAIEDAVRAIGEEDRVVVLTGAGDRVFASGADLSELGQGESGGLGGDFGQAMEAAQAAIEEGPLPVIARIQGHSLGAHHVRMLHRAIVLVR